MKTNELMAFARQTASQDEQFQRPTTDAKHSPVAVLLLVLILAGGVGFFWKEISAARSELLPHDQFMGQLEIESDLTRSPIYDLSITPFGESLFYRDHHGIVRSQNLFDDEENLQAYRDVFADVFAEQMIFSPTKNSLVVATRSGEVLQKKWDTPDSDPTVLLTSEQAIECMDYSLDGRLLAAGLSNGTVVVLDLFENTTAAIFRRRGQNLSSLKFESELSLLVSFDSGLERWQLNVKKQKPSNKQSLGYRRRMVWKIDQPAAREMIVSNDGKFLIAASFDNYIRCWDLETLEQKWEFRGTLPCARSLRMSPDGSFFICQSEPYSLNFRDPETGETLATLVDKSMGTGTGARFSLDGKLLYTSSSDGLIRVWTVPGQTLIGTVESENSPL